jgi:glucokinase
MPDPVLALDLGGTKVRGALVHGADSAEPRLEGIAETATPAAEGPAAILAAALDLAARVRAGSAVRAVGLSSAGVVDSARGRITHATASLRDWAGTDVVAPFRDRFGVPVSTLNDVHAHGLGEARFGAGRDRGSLLLVAVGTGIGGCHVLGGGTGPGGTGSAGAVVAGAHGAAGHIGHVPVPEAAGIPCPCGRTGHLEGLAAGPGIVQLAHRLGAEPALRDGRALATAASAGDRAAREAYRVAGFATGRVIGALLNVLDPDVVAVTGGVAEAGGPWYDALTRGIRQEAMDVVADTPVLPATAGSHAALLGAAARCLDDLAAPTAARP